MPFTFEARQRACSRPHAPRHRYGSTVARLRAATPTTRIRAARVRVRDVERHGGCGGCVRSGHGGGLTRQRERDSTRVGDHGRMTFVTMTHHSISAVLPCPSQHFMHTAIAFVIALQSPLLTPGSRFVK
jgi:hypothetical protein